MRNGQPERLVGVEGEEYIGGALAPALLIASLL